MSSEVEIKAGDLGDQVMTHDEMIAILEAHRDGRVVQFEREGVWIDYEGEGPPAVPNGACWRVKPFVVCGTGVLFRGNELYIVGDKKVAGSFAGRMTDGMWGGLITVPSLPKDELFGLRLLSEG
jgi:hypothetical protein